MPNLDITYSDLNDTATFMDTGRASIETTLLSLQNRVLALTASGYRTDQASGEYELSYKALNDGIRQAVAGLEGMAAFLRATADAYTEVDSQMAAGIRG